MPVMVDPVLPLHDPAFWQDPWPVINDLRESVRVARTDDGTRVILRHADVEALLGGDSFINEGISLLERRGFKPGEPFHRWRELALGSRNGDDHRRIRGLVGRAMGARQMSSFEPLLQRCIDRQLAAVIDTDVDAVTAIGQALPLAVIGEYLGIPAVDRQRVDQLVREGQAQAFGVNVTEAIRQRVNTMFAVLLEFVEQLIDARRMQPQNDLLSDLLSADVAADRLDREETVALFLNLFVGATESTGSALASGLLILGRDPSILPLLRREPATVDRFVEEVLRLYPPNLVIANKIAGADLEFCGEHFRNGERVVIPIGAPNRDPRVWVDPDRVVLDRPPLRHFSFSFGSHFCLGQALARAQLRRFFTTLAQTVRWVEVRAPQPKWVPFAAVSRMEQLPLRLHSRPDGVGVVR